MNIAHVEKQSFIYGPGCRFEIWVQGCSLRCKGCWNDSMWNFTPRKIFAHEELLSAILSLKNIVEGVTFLGGEPLDQFTEVSALIKDCKINGFSTMLFTGYEMHEIEQKRMSGILSSLDILITGRYDETKRTLHHQWIGSTNQTIHFLSDRYKGFQIEDANYSEISIAEDGRITILGFPDAEVFHLIENGD